MVNFTPDPRTQALANCRFLYGPETEILTISSENGFQMIAMGLDRFTDTWKCAVKDECTHGSLKSAAAAFHKLSATHVGLRLEASSTYDLQPAWNLNNDRYDSPGRMISINGPCAGWPMVNGHQLYSKNETQAEYKTRAHVTNSFGEDDWTTEPRDPLARQDATKDSIGAVASPQPAAENWFCDVEQDERAIESMVPASWGLAAKRQGKRELGSPAWLPTVGEPGTGIAISSTEGHSHIPAIAFGGPIDGTTVVGLASGDPPKEAVPEATRSHLYTLSAGGILCGGLLRNEKENFRRVPAVCADHRATHMHQNIPRTVVVEEALRAPNYSIAQYTYGPVAEPTDERVAEPFYNRSGDPFSVSDHSNKKNGELEDSSPRSVTWFSVEKPSDMIESPESQAEVPSEDEAGCRSVASEVDIASKRDVVFEPGFEADECAAAEPSGQTSAEPAQFESSSWFNNCPSTEQDSQGKGNVFHFDGQIASSFNRPLYPPHRPELETFRPKAMMEAQELKMPEPEMSVEAHSSDCSGLAMEILDGEEYSMDLMEADSAGEWTAHQGEPQDDKRRDVTMQIEYQKKTYVHCVTLFRNTKSAILRAAKEIIEPIANSNNFRLQREYLLISARGTTGPIDISGLAGGDWSRRLDYFANQTKIPELTVKVVELVLGHESEAF